MTFLSRSLLLVGSVLLAHACYSAQEHSTLTSLRNSTFDPSNPTSPDSIPLPSVTNTSLSRFTSLPLDITIETLVSVAILCVAIVLGAEELKPISWRVWAGQIERRKLEGKKAVENVEHLGRPREEGYEWLENEKRLGFLDIRKHRREFAEWAKGNGGNKKS